MDIDCFMGCPSLKSIAISDNSKEFKLDLSYQLYQIMKSKGIKCTGNIWITNKEEMPTDVDCKFIKPKELLNHEIVKFDSLQIIPLYFNRSDAGILSYLISYFSKFNMKELCKIESLGNLKHIILSFNVVSINKIAFSNMKSLERINLKNEKEINYFCFENCMRQ